MEAASYDRCRTCVHGGKYLATSRINGRTHEVWTCQKHSFPWKPEPCPYKGNGLELPSQSIESMRKFLSDYDHETSERGNKKMVKRKKEEFVQIEQFDGLVEEVERVEGKAFDDREPGEQYHMVMRPLDKATIEAVSESKTQRLHNYIRISQTTADDAIAEGSTLDAYITEVEYVLPATKKLETHLEVMNALKGKKFRFVRKKIGRAYKGFEAKTAFVPKEVLK